MTGQISVLAICTWKMTQTIVSCDLNSTEESEWGLENVEFYTLIAIILETVQAVH